MTGDRGRLAGALKRKPDDPEVERMAELLARAGAVELMALATGQAVFSSMADLRSFRIFCLLSQGMELKDAETLTAMIFKVNAATAGRLVTNASARYSVELEAGMHGFAQAVLNKAEPDEREYQWNLRVPTAALRERFESVLKRGNLPGPTATGLEGVLRYPDESYKELRKEFDLPSRPWSKPKAKKK
jgi:hypothetical protein